ncbi:bifunctional hydroxymethylpyrimidine kinase/phosphomethylpyrimidine kinase [Paenibacillus oenotherae]|uniref:Hydroxymethylpyrimidine/phosphomethylpyrimidine kinase n=1 Tax=Paenibacillus oenotherae TaxID=1435645 RepID=A0ABS7D3K1_9BACL|nr:bifunctional hydroxymethylpyrimidine kinase/phosphomethylpyrimidine kinase [Paenibacillus oenotherae]MBW7474505.1 bifunctional hydroxymethylpyrimidine kinase/phosphomethylpyrimidine kinase [Paenibacillus oenotherae]
MKAPDDYLADARSRSSGEHLGRHKDSSAAEPPRILIVAGSDSGGGAGIQADLKTCQELGVFGMTAITAVTAQNSTGVQAIHPVPLEMVEAQLDSVLGDIGSKVMKTGMLLSPDVVQLVAQSIQGHGVAHVVVDPVLHAKDGSALLRAEAISSLRTMLFPLAEVITPNIPEACELLGWPESAVASVDDMIEAAYKLLEFGPRYVLLKGGHLRDNGDQPPVRNANSSANRTYIDFALDHSGRGGALESDGFAVDVLLGTEQSHAAKPIILRSPRLQTAHTHGTGCTTASALAACLALGLSVPKAAIKAKRFVTDAISCSVPLGSGVGSLWHAAHRRK